MDIDEKFRLLSDISHIIDNIYLGGFEGAKNKQLLKKHNIKAVVSIMEPMFLSQLTESSDIMYHYIPISDHPGEIIKPWVDNFFQFMETNRDKNILIHCMMGISRSATFTILYLMKNYKVSDISEIIDDKNLNQNLSLIQTLGFVKKKRPIINPNYGFIKQLEMYQFILNHNFEDK